MTMSFVCGHGLFVFFFSSRRRHTRFDCDWSSDVCSSDLKLFQRSMVNPNMEWEVRQVKDTITPGHAQFNQRAYDAKRSEERRVGKECRSRWSAYYEKKKKERKYCELVDDEND